MLSSTILYMQKLSISDSAINPKFDQRRLLFVFTDNSNSWFLRLKQINFIKSLHDFIFVLLDHVDIFKFYGFNNHRHRLLYKMKTKEIYAYHWKFLKKQINRDKHRSNFTIHGFQLSGTKDERLQSYWSPTHVSWYFFSFRSCFSFFLYLLELYRQT